MEKVFEQKRLGEILTEAEIINSLQLEKALEVQRTRNKKLGQILVGLGYTDEEIVLSLLGKKLNSAYVKLSEYGKIESEIIRSVPESIARQNILIPIERDSRTLVVAMADPQNTFVKDILHLMTGFDIKAHISSEREIKSAIDEHYKRLRTSSSKCLSLNKLGFDESSLALYKKYIEMDSGLILITGPGGSGKSTTLYSTLNALNFPDRNIISVEESIECILDGINQVEIKPDIGLNFSSGLRKCLDSLDADIIVVGEIKDIQTARLAINAADSGYLVFCVINTDEFLPDKDRVSGKDSSGSHKIIEFLINIGIQPYLVASAVKMIVNQRLIRSVCGDCKQVHMPPVDLLEGMGIKISKNLRLYQGKGCKFCDYTGFEGFTACFEVLTMNDKIRDLVIEGFSSESIRQTLKESGMISLQRAGVNKVLRGETTLNEMLRVIDITDVRELTANKESVIKDADEFYWDVFEKTGSINAYLLSKGKKLPEQIFKRLKTKKATRIRKKKSIRKS